MWVVQRLSWTALLTAGFVAMIGLLGALEIGDTAHPRPRCAGVRARTARRGAPSVCSRSEAHPQLLAPAVLWPLVLVHRGRLGAAPRAPP